MFVGKMIDSFSSEYVSLPPTFSFFSPTFLDVNEKQVFYPLGKL